jgi:NADPH:quinone reductase-like Zn-dependent oxidoreductase
MTLAIGKGKVMNETMGTRRGSSSDDEFGGAFLVKRIQYHRYGGPEVLRVEEFALAAPGRGQICVRIRAAAANPMDWKIRNGEMKMMTGRKFPRGLGHDFAGVVEAVGPNVTRFKVGDEVFGATGLKESGTFAEALVTEDKTVFLKPQSLSIEEAALPIVSATAWTALIDKAKLQAGQRVFVTGCLGAVGRVAAQIAGMRGAEIAGSCSASRRDEAPASGVREVVDYHAFNANTYRGPFDVVFDTHVALSPSQCGAMLKRGGVALHIVPTPLKMIWSMLSSRHQTVFGKVTPQSLGALLRRSNRASSRRRSAEPCRCQKRSRPSSNLRKPAYRRENWWSFPSDELTIRQRWRVPYESFIHNISPVLTDATEPQMIIELADIRIHPGQNAAFEEAIQRGRHSGRTRQGLSELQGEPWHRIPRALYLADLLGQAGRPHRGFPARAAVFRVACHRRPLRRRAARCGALRDSVLTLN